MEDKETPILVDNAVLKNPHRLKIELDFDPDPGTISWAISMFSDGKDGFHEGEQLYFKPNKEQFIGVLRHISTIMEKERG